MELCPHLVIQQCANGFTHVATDVGEEFMQISLHSGGSCVWRGAGNSHIQRYP